MRPGLQRVRSPCGERVSAPEGFPPHPGGVSAFGCRVDLRARCPRHGNGRLWAGIAVLERHVLRKVVNPTPEPMAVRPGYRL